MSERDLWCAVLENAINEARGARIPGDTEGTSALHRRQAHDWITKPNRDFTLVCHLAGFDPEAVRERAVKLLAEPYVPRRQRQRSDAPKRTGRTSVKAKRITFKGETHTLSEWAKITGLSVGTINSRLRRGWTVERMLTEPMLSRSQCSRQRKARGRSRTSKNSEGTGAGASRESEPNWSNFQDAAE